jgi:hypothetical protein
MKYIQPTSEATSFTCPHCGVLAKQDWTFRNWRGGNDGRPDKVHEIKIGRCQHCNESTLWIYEVMFFPDKGNAPHPSPDMPEKVEKLYQEASSISNKSPRGAAALLRLALQILCVELGEEGKNINDDIAGLVKKGLSPIVQKSLDIVRVTGNEAVHPGQIDTDNPETVGQLFILINIIVQTLITTPKEVNELYGQLPKEILGKIEKRDK